jgi:hypothetical protein
MPRRSLLSEASIWRDLSATDMPERSGGRISS